jgi:hypothetical protein
LNFDYQPTKSRKSSQLPAVLSGEKMNTTRSAKTNGTLGGCVPFALLALVDFWKSI